MQTWRAIVRTLSGSAALAGSTTVSRGLLELTEAQLEQVAGGGGKPNVGTTGTSAGNSVAPHKASTIPGALSSMTNGPNGGPAPHPDGGKGGLAGSMG
jgi:hypothetical protein